MMQTTDICRGARRLKDLGTQREIAARLGVSQQAVSQWITGKLRPNGDLRLVIQRVFGIAVDDWTNEARGRRAAKRARGRRHRAAA